MPSVLGTQIRGCRVGLASCAHPAAIDQDGIVHQPCQAQTTALGQLSRLGGKRPADRHRERVAVHTRPRTPRHVPLCRAFGGWLVVSLAVPLLAALSPRLGDSSSSCKAPLGLPVGFRGHPRVRTLADQHRLDYTARGSGWRG